MSQRFEGYQAVARVGIMGGMIHIERCLYHSNMGYSDLERLSV